MVNVRITVDEALNNGAIVRPPNENRSISRLGKGTCEDQIPTAVGFPREREMGLPERGAPSYVVVNQCVLQQVVTHAASVIRAARKNASTSTVSLGRSRRSFTPISKPLSMSKRPPGVCQPSLAPNFANRGLSGITRRSETAALNRHDNQPSRYRANEI
jgi:hypothetical protein